ncbi:MAG TPA: hypothetical protein VND65_20810 [Candidatus Binatia bacterium]|nr:hypothetical protein [Candidatus Binatia bacterium]
MIDKSLIAEKIVVDCKGDGPVIDLHGAEGGVFLVTLDITKIIEQESLEVGILGSGDGTTWDPKPLLAFPQKFYCGSSPLLLDLKSHPEVKFLRAHWEVARWGRGSETPMFEFDLRLREVPPEVLRDAAAEAKALA